MKKLFLSTLAIASALCAFGAVKPIVYNGDTLELNEEFKRSQVGCAPTVEMPEISGMSCSRETPGYLWVMSDDNYKVVALKEPSVTWDVAKVAMSLTLTDKPSRSDWEGLSTGIWQGKNYIFVGGFGDNDLKKNDKYYIFYFEEPRIPATRVDSTIPIGTRYIHYGYPDTMAHNTETLMYDNVDQVLYIVDKVEKNVNSVFSLNMKDTVYGNDLVRLKKECELGKQGEYQFQRATAGDITPDGHWILIKNNTDNYSYTLIWERMPGESVADALKRQPKQVAAYKREWQGEAIAWLDENTFYTTSDEDEGNPPIYKYTRVPAGFTTAEINAIPVSKKIMIGDHIYIRQDDILYDLQGQPIK